jgi:methyl-accepting chemotaxis protein
MFRRARPAADDAGVDVVDAASVETVKAELWSLHEHCLTNLSAGHRAMNEGDLTIEVQPATRPIEARPGYQVGELGEVFNSVLAKAQAESRRTT